MGANTTFNQTIADEICRRIISGETLKTICDEDGMPSAPTVQNWRHKNIAFNEQYADAREFQAETIFDQMLEIADTPCEGERVTEDHNGTKTVTEDMLGHRELQIKTRQWMLPRMSKKMTDKAQLDHTSSDGSMSPMTDEAVAARLNAIQQSIIKRLAAKKQPEGFIGDDGSDLA